MPSSSIGSEEATGKMVEGAYLSRGCDFFRAWRAAKPATLSLVREFWRHRRKLLSFFLSVQAAALRPLIITQPI
jgi:hypothetical protein